MLFSPRKVYLDHNAATPVDRRVRRVIQRCLKRIPGNPSALHTQGLLARGCLDQARLEVAALLGCHPGRVLFTSGGTEANNAVIQGVFRSSDGGHIVTSRIEHESVLGACEQVEAEGGTVTYLKAGRDGCIRVEDVEAVLARDTVLVSIMHANHETGAIQPVAEIAALARSRGVPMHTDAVQTFGKIDCQVDALGVEFLTLSAHKINGPKGVGALYWRGSTGWAPLIAGGAQEQGRRAGTEGVAQIAGLGAAAKLAAGRMRAEHVRLAALRARFLTGLRELFPELAINQAPAKRQLPGTMNLTFPGHEGIRLLAGLDCYEISSAIGSACTADRIEPSHVLLGMGLAPEAALASIRLSMGVTTGWADLRYTLKVFGQILQGDPPGSGFQPTTTGSGE